MHHLRAFTSSVANMAKDLTKDISMAPDDFNANGKRYVIGGRTIVEERLLSEGGFGFVHLVRDVNTNQQYVIKKILCQDKERFELASREIELFEKLPLHPNLVKYFGHIIEKDAKTREVIFLMEYCPGGHVYDLMKKNPSGVSTGDILRVLRDICSGLIALHSMNVQHRDLKLENVILNANGKYVLIDFGSWSSQCPDLSNISREALGKFGETVERYTTLMYRPPEMADLYKGFKISTKVDMWMLGCVLFTLVNNKHPFQDASNLAIVNCRYSFVPDMCARHPPKLVQLCSWLLAGNPADRPSAPELAKILDTWENGDPLTLPQSVIDRIEKDARLYGIPNVVKGCTRRRNSKTDEPLTVWAEPTAASDDWQASFPPVTQPATQPAPLLDLLG